MALFNELGAFDILLDVLVVLLPIDIPIEVPVVVAVVVLLVEEALLVSTAALARKWDELNRASIATSSSAINAKNPTLDIFSVLIVFVVLFYNRCNSHPFLASCTTAKREFSCFTISKSL